MPSICVFGPSWVVVRVYGLLTLQISGFPYFIHTHPHIYKTEVQYFQDIETNWSSITERLMSNWGKQMLKTQNSWLTTSILYKACPLFWCSVDQISRFSLSVENGHLEFVRISFGLKKSPSMFRSKAELSPLTDMTMIHLITSLIAYSKAQFSNCQLEIVRILGNILETFTDSDQI